MYFLHTIALIKRILVLPAASKPSMRMRISLLPKIFDKSLPILLADFLRSWHLDEHMKSTSLLAYIIIDLSINR